ncbi:DEAD/DEAH box helicase [Acinetobacter haemolyticus]|uniref:DEAD/DEAH box helicase n=1 Tax=Acinetobacter haemolyticus TaxID=29430 RepID=UPI000D69B15A|nr:DEAD/DEAH box helicase [Acinetobacter haemolyticus]
MKDEFQTLHPSVQRWVYKQGWPDLREIQKKALNPILSGDRDVLISASTAAGKTEAFFLPACSKIANLEAGFGILYISPLKALINDQFRRLESLGEELKIPITPWHGDSLQSRKNNAKKNPLGILLITPESLESLLIRESGWLKTAFSNIKYIAIDEFHAFIGTDRGQHLLSLLNRIDHLLGQYAPPIPRIALSATLGELETVPLALRPNQKLPCEIITTTKNSATMQVQVKGYINPFQNKSDHLNNAEAQIFQDIYKFCRGGSHLVFANSRQRTESIANALGELCRQNRVPNEFFPHHGSLAKELREELEHRLQKKSLPTTAVCTMTLELGIDIGKVNSVIQVTSPHSVASLRQRMGRSGRRSEPAILRMLIKEEELTKNSHIVDMLRLELIQSLAMIRLLIASKWFEPADTSQFHFSTLLHQILAIIAQWGGVRPDQIYTLLCKTGPFNKVSIIQFKILLTCMGENDLIVQLKSGELTLGLRGEQIVNHYSFYAVFKTPEEYRIISGSKTLGTLPITTVVLKDQHIIFAGKRWKILDVESDKKVIRVIAAKGGLPPSFGGEGLSVHSIVRQEMFEILKNNDYRITVGAHKVDFIDRTAKLLFDESIAAFNGSNLANQSIIEVGQKVYIFTWLGDKITDTLKVIFVMNNFLVTAISGVIEIEQTTKKAVIEYLKAVLTRGIPTEQELAVYIQDKVIEKFDEYLNEELLNQGYGIRMFDSKNTFSYIHKLLAAEKI